uniref:NADH-ubiquinone oxidoreductase chain 3 n=2 Tax=unclassified Prolachesilla TaxID=2635580 RepID=A0A8K1ZFK2_9NEOP|nr:NADH dehydrogenase subunit 3 [Prolachesilla sp. GRAspLA]UGS80302.1 NADH dehydrogenase subunit 3 [Prolachesilla sp. GRA2sp1LA]
MMNIMYTFMMIAIIANVMMLLCLILSKKSLFDREKLSSFECGFDQKSSSRIPFSLRFFLITLIFLIFDVEIAILMPSIYNMETSNILSWILMNLFFIIILIVGIIHEWNQGSLEWTN